MPKGFFSSSNLRKPLRLKPLPPQLKIKVEGETPKTKSKTQEPPKSNLPQKVMDVECYVNYFLVKFMNVEDGNWIEFERTADCKLNVKGIKKILKEHEIITFNGNMYDIPILRLAFTGATNKELKTATNEIIKGTLSLWKFEEKYEVPETKINHIDLIELMPGMSSLKIYGGRMHCDLMQDLPIEESAKLTEKEMIEIAKYCGNDLTITKLMLKNRYEQIELRRTMSEIYGLDLRSKSDAQIAEAVIKHEYEKCGKSLEKQPARSDDFYYQAPDFIEFDSEVLNRALRIVTRKPFEMSNSGRPIMPKELSDLVVKIGNTEYNMGMGGLHSTEKSAFHLADEDTKLFDWDVTSYYPSIILNCDLFPEQMGQRFLKLYRSIVEERVAAKKNGDKVKAEVLKIVLNGSFGKFGSPYSLLYAPDLMVQVTVTGQLSLLMLIEEMEDMDIPVVSANTDGIVIKCSKDDEKTMRTVIKRWEKKTGFNMEESNYVGLYSRDVNNYMAFKQDGSVKLKGCFTPPDVNKNPENEICTIAMIEYLKNGTPIRDTILDCKDITKFVTVRKVEGGAVKNDDYLGKAIRFYHARNERTAIHYKNNGKQVASTEGCKPIMNIRVDFPDDVDIDWYIQNCHTIFGK